MKTPLQLADAAYAASEPALRCPHLRHGPRGCCCAVVAERTNELAGLTVCDDYSVLLWCLAGPERWPECSFWPKGDV